MKVSELFGRVELPYPPALGDIELKNIVTDSRKATEGSLFLCIEGQRADGHGHWEEAIMAGACMIVTERVRDTCVGGAAAQIVLENTRRAAALLYHAWYGRPCDRLKIIGVTGTNGKTSVATLLSELLSAGGHPCGLIGTVCAKTADGRVLSHSSGMTTPEPEELYSMLAEMAAAGDEFVAMEVSSHALDQHRVDAISFEAALFTNLSRDHLDFHGTLSEYFDRKKRLFARSRRAFVCVDGAAGRSLWNELKNRKLPVLSCSVGEGDYCAHDIVSRGLDGSCFHVRTPRGDLALSVGAAGEFAVINSVMAAAVALEYGVAEETVASVLKESRGAVGRMEPVGSASSDDPSVLIDYAHTPDALERLLRSVRRMVGQEGRLVLLFGCGGDRDRGKRKEMAMIASRLADEVILTSDNSRSEDPHQILRDLLRGINKEKPYRVIPDRREAILTAVGEARSTDWIVLAGKGHEQYEIRADGRHDFDERAIVREGFCLRRTTDGSSN